MPEIATRTESDSLGSREIPAESYWGIHTLRAQENFPIGVRRIGDYPDLVVALAQVKQAAARANITIGVLDAVRGNAIDAACAEIIKGQWHEEFVVGVIQGGAGTSTNMNGNEVIANRALELLGAERGQYDRLSPIDHVNRSQSTNDVYPTAVKIAMIHSLRRLLHEHDALGEAFKKKSIEFAEVVKVGRTQLQDAVPMTLGQEFGGFSTTLTEDRERLLESIPWLCEINLGATAIGTGITADPRYADLARGHLAQITGLPIVTAPDLIEATSDTGVFMTVSGLLKRAAIKLSKICNDLRLLSSGPQAGLGEINLPPRQAGSSIMPGKVNPVIPEVFNQIAFTVMGADTTVAMASEAGQLQLNAFEPVIAHSILQSIDWMTRGMKTLRENCVEGITANEVRLAQSVASNVGVVTALSPFIGYAAAAALAHSALDSGRTIAELVLEAGLMTGDEIAIALSPRRLSGMP
jgi:aspartate ammonia-lyase